MRYLWSFLCVILVSSLLSCDSIEEQLLTVSDVGAVSPTASTESTTSSETSTDDSSSSGSSSSSSSTSTSSTQTSSSATVTVNLSVTPSIIYESGQLILPRDEVFGSSAGGTGGYQVSLSGDGLIMAQSELGNDLVRVFNWSGTAWSQYGTDINGQAVGEGFGNDIALSDDGETIVVGAPMNADNGLFAGHAAIFDLTGGTWNRRGLAIEGAAGDFAGTTVDISEDGDVVAIGYPGNDGAAGGGSVAGMARVFEWTGLSWTQKGGDILGAVTLDNLGRCIALSGDGDRLAVGAPNSNSGRGHVSLYSWSGVAWVQMGSDIVGALGGEASCSSMAMSDDGGTIIVGSENADVAGTNDGLARVYRYNGATWAQIGTNLVGEAVGDHFGSSVDISDDGNTIMIGAVGHNNGGANAGQFQIYEFIGGSWVPKIATVDGDVGEYLGASAALSDDGSVAASGATLNSEFAAVAGAVLSLDMVALPGVATVTATLAQAVSENVTVTLLDGGNATGAGVDYTLSSSTITIPASQLQGSVTVTSVADQVLDPSENIFLDIATVTNAVEHGVQRVSITIGTGN